MAGKARPLVPMVRVTLLKGRLDDPITHPRLLNLEIPNIGSGVPASQKPLCLSKFSSLTQHFTPLQPFNVTDPFPTNDIKIRPTVE